MSYYSSWNTVKNSVNTLLVHFHHLRGVELLDDPVNLMYKNNLPRAIEDTLTLCFVHDMDRKSPTVQIVLRAYEQLEKEGRIGCG